MNALSLLELHFADADNNEVEPVQLWPAVPTEGQTIRFGLGPETRRYRVYAVEWFVYEHEATGARAGAFVRLVRTQAPGDAPLLRSGTRVVDEAAVAASLAAGARPLREESHVHPGRAERAEQEREITALIQAAAPVIAEAHEAADRNTWKEPDER